MQTKRKRNFSAKQSKCKDTEKAMTKNSQSNKMEFKEQKEVLLRSMKHGDKTEIVRLSGVTLQTWRNTMSRERLSEMTDTELKVWETAIEYVINRKKRLNQKEKLNAKKLKSC